MLLGIDISEREVAVILAKPDGSAERAMRATMPRVGGANAAWLVVVETVRQLLLESHLVSSQIEKTAVAFFAPIATDENGDEMVRKDFRSGSWAGFDLSRALREHLGLAGSRVETRVQCAALGEQRLGALRESDNWLYVHLGQNVEAAACVNGALLTGKNRAALELGAVCIDRDGALGESGRRGVLNAYCGQEAFMARIRSYGLTFQTPREVWDSYDTNYMAKSQCDDYVERLSQGIGTACALLNPSRVVLGGELFQVVGEKLLSPLSAHLKEYCLPIHSENLQILAGQLGTDAAVLGTPSAVEA